MRLIRKNLWEGKPVETSTIVTYVRAVARLKSVSAAAEELGITQPALSARLKKLEDQLGAQVFDRSSNPISLTEAGEAYLATQEQIDVLNHQLACRISDIKELKCGSLAIGGPGFFNATVLPAAIAAFTQRYPGIRTQVVTDTVPNLTKAAASGAIDLFVTPLANKSLGLTYQEILTEKVFLCLSPNAPLVTELPPIGPEGYGILGEEDLRKLQQLPFIMLSETLQIGRIARQLLQAHDLTPAQTIEVDQTMTGMALALAGAGVCMVAESALRGGVFEKPALYLADPQICTRTLYLAQKRGAASLASQAFIEILQETL